MRSQVPPLASLGRDDPRGGWKKRPLPARGMAVFLCYASMFSVAMTSTPELQTFSTTTSPMRTGGRTVVSRITRRASKMRGLRIGGRDHAGGIGDLGLCIGLTPGAGIALDVGDFLAVIIRRDAAAHGTVDAGQFVFHASGTSILTKMDSASLRPASFSAGRLRLTISPGARIMVFFA